MTNITASNSSITWDTPCEEPPRSDAPLGERVDYIEDRLVEMKYAKDPETGRYVAHHVPRAAMRQLAEYHGFDWSKIAAGLRRNDMVNRNPNQAEKPDTTTKHGIVVKESVFHKITQDLAPMCPYILRRLPKGGFRLAKKPKQCGSWVCHDCGPDKADDLLGEVAKAISNLDEVFIGEATWRSGLAPMMGQRRRTAGAEWFWYRDVSNKVTYLADKPMPGSKHPAIWRRMRPVEAMEYVAKRVLWVPGHVDHGWSPGWAPPTALPSEGGEDCFDIDDLSDVEIQRAISICADVAERDFGVRLADGYVPQQLKPRLIDLMQECLNEVRAAKAQSDDGLGSSA